MSRSKATKVFLVGPATMPGAQATDWFIIGRHPKGALSAAKAQDLIISADTEVREVDESYRNRALNLAETN